MPERYPTYQALKEDKLRRPTGAMVVLVHPGASMESLRGRDRLYGDLNSAGSSQPPQGIASLAAILRENGYSAKLIDAEPIGIGAQETAELAMAENPKYVGISSYTLSIRVSAAIARRIKEIAKEKGVDVKVIIGGPHATFLPEKVIERYSEFDFGVRGEGEITIVELIDALEHGEPLDNIPNLVHRVNGVVKMNVRRSGLMDMDSLPMPAWELLPSLKDHYHPAGDNLHRLPSVTLITSRGCPGKCVFCNPRGLGSDFRRHSAAYIIKMMKYLQNNFQIRDIFIVDDMFITDRQNVLDLCRLLKEDKELDITWSVFARVDAVDDELLREMKSARCWQVGYGLESGSEKILKNINKNQSIAQMEKAIRAADNAGLIVRGLFMVGSFGETQETIQETIDFARRNPIKDFHVTFFTPMPGTGSFKMWKQYGTWDADEEEGSTRSLHGITFLAHGFTEKDLIRSQKRLYHVLLKGDTLLYQLGKFIEPSTRKRFLRGARAWLYYTFLQPMQAHQLQEVT